MYSTDHIRIAGFKYLHTIFVLCMCISGNFANKTTSMAEVLPGNHFLSFWLLVVLGVCIHCRFFFFMVGRSRALSVLFILMSI